MLYLRHACEHPSTRQRFVQEELRSAALHLLFLHCDGGTKDEQLEHIPPGIAPRMDLVLVARGRAAVRTPGGAVELREGEGWLSPRLYAAPARSLTAGTSLLHLVWRPGGPAGDGLPTGGLVRVPPSAWSTLRPGPLGDREGAVRFGERLAAQLRSQGIPLAPDAFEAAGASIEPADATFAQALQQVLFPLRARPMAVDLARVLGCSERHALRHASRYFGRYHLSVCTWREYVRGMRLGLGVFFMSHKRSRTDQASALLGFASPVAFCHALKEAGLPSPGAVRDTLQLML
ncbi:uncharacterized protein SOCE26_102820 [Sorangium cellulosum]|uniref:Uncharacterized protein n=1 Tax=Sorangium cellulosum TaxID=56 RepID=A0A2L0FB36_SORCE|nr:AraC family transcriptional regulator [Sorangium cellulosum]AUX48741.1 uncharacterized protein SOCE26_102820 [Sorangium cellulosum]